MAADDDAFREAVLAHSFEHGPRLVWADRLDELGDPRGAWLRHWCALEAAALAVPAADPGAAAPPAGWLVQAARLFRRRPATIRPALAGRLRAALAAYPGDRRLPAVALTGALPAGGGARLRDLL